MRKTLGLEIVFLVIMLGFMLGCSAGVNPTTPIDNRQPAPSGSMDKFPMIGGDAHEDGSFEALGLLGAYELQINPEKMSAELVSERYPSLGQSWIVSGGAFFVLRPCSDCLKVKAVSLTVNNDVQLTFAIKHPFEAGDPSQPPTGLNRLDLDIFDLAVVVVPTNVLKTRFSLLGVDAYPGILVNNAGYTRELAEVLNNSAAMPYALVVDDSIAGLKTWNEFSMGMDKLFDVCFSSKAASSTNFLLYLTMGYGSSAEKRKNRLNPVYFNPEFNRKSAWKVDVIPPQGNNPPGVGNTWQDNDSTTYFDVKIKVYDWQQGVTAIANPPVNPGDIAYSSSVAYVTVEIPGMTNTLTYETTQSSGTGAPNDPLIFDIWIANERSLPAGEYFGLVKVADSRIPKNLPPMGSTDFLIDSPDGSSLVYETIPEFVTYQAFPATVVMGCGPITGSIISPACPITDAVNNTKIDFMVTAESANGGDPIVLYEADWDYGGSTFQANATSTNGVFLQGGPFVVADPCYVNVPHAYKVAFRATDSCVPPHKTIFATCNVTVAICTPSPVGNVILTVNRQGINSNYQVNSTNPWTLIWSAAPGAVEYAVYYDSDPSDGLINSLSYVGATYTTHYDVPSTHLPANHYVIGNTYIVRSRGAMGNPSSEAANSQPAFITLSGWETLGLPVNPGEGWVTNCQMNSSLSQYRPRTTTQFSAQGTLSCQFSDSCGQSFSNRWNGMTKATPSVPNSTVRRLECSAYHYQTSEPAGLIFGTSSSQPTTSWSTTNVVEWASVDSGGAYTGYSNISTDAVSTFDGVPSTVNNSWVNSSVITRRFLYGGDVNVDGNPSDPYVAIEFVMLGFGSQPYPFIDEVTIAIY